MSIASGNTNRAADEKANDKTKVATLLELLHKREECHYHKVTGPGKTKPRVVKFGRAQEAKDIQKEIDRIKKKK